MASTKPSSRYPSFDARSSTSSQVSDPSSSAEFRKNLRNPSKNQSSSLKKLVGVSGKMPNVSSNATRALVKAKSGDLVQGKVKNEQNLSSMVKKFMERRSKTAKGNGAGLVIPVDFIAEDLKKNGAKGGHKGSNFTALHKKLFQKGKGDRSEVKALTEVKSNTRTLAMVLRSERELLGQNKEQEMEITELKLIIEERSREVEKLKDLCLKQREEIKALKSAVLFPDVMNTQLQGLLETQGSELRQAKQVIPTLQRQVTSLTDQLQCLADDLAEVKADKYAGTASFDSYVSSPRTPMFDQEAMNSLEFSSGDPTSPASQDDMFLKDLNPCLTPCSAKSKSKEFDEMMGYDHSYEKGSYGNNRKACKEYRPQGGKTSKSSEYDQRPSVGSAFARPTRRSDESKGTYGKPMHQKWF